MPFTLLLSIFEAIVLFTFWHHLLYFIQFHLQHFSGQNLLIRPAQPMTELCFHYSDHPTPSVISECFQ